MNSKYEDMLNMPHHQSKTRSHMSMHDRAAQFSPFAALTGYEDAVKEAARLTSEKIILGEDALAEINKKLNSVIENISSHPSVTFVYFEKDEKKAGGRYTTVTDFVKKIDEENETIILQNGTHIPICDVYEVYSETII